MKNAIQYYWENHAIKTEEINVRIKDNIYNHRNGS
jgi:hypothetical protein